MKAFTKILIVYVLIFSNILLAGNPIDKNTVISTLQKQRTEQYLKYISMQGEGTDSLKVIFANSLLETDNQIIAKINSLDSLQKNQAFIIKSLETKTIADKQLLLLASAAGGLMFLLFTAFLILFLISRSKSKKNKNENLLIKKNIEIQNIELNTIKKEKITNEVLFNENITNIQSDLRLKNEIITNLESKFKDYNQNETNLRESVNAAKKEVEIMHEKLSTTLNQCNELLVETEKQKQTVENLIDQKNQTENILKNFTEQNVNEKDADDSLIADSLKLVEENKTLLTKIEKLQAEKFEIIMEIKHNIDEKEKLYNKINLLENEVYDLKLRHPEHQIEAIREMVEKNIETLKLSNTKLSVEKEHLEKSLRMREPEDALMVKINKLIEENYNLQLDLENETIYAEKLNKTLDKYLDELEKQDLELELLSMKVKDRTMPENRIKFDEMELNLIKLEKLNRLKEILAITEEEYQQMKLNIITQI